MQKKISKSEFQSKGPHLNRSSRKRIEKMGVGREINTIIQENSLEPKDMNFRSDGLWGYPKVPE